MEISFYTDCVEKEGQEKRRGKVKKKTSKIKQKLSLTSKNKYLNV